MNYFDLPTLQKLLENILQTERDFQSFRENEASVDDRDIAIALEVIKQAENACLENSFATAREVVERTLGNWELLTKDYSTMESELRHIRESITSELVHHQFLRVNPDRVRFLFSGKHAMSVEVFQAFPEAAEDIQETANCMATECATAAVFHAMRVVEWGLRALCGHLGILRVRKTRKPGKKKYISIEYSQWERMLEEVQDRVDKRIAKLGPGKRKQDLQEFYYPLMRDLKGFKDAWRNHVMHTRATYDRDQAASVFSHVKQFMNALSKIHKSKTKKGFASIGVKPKP